MSDLVKVAVAAKALGLSKHYLYKGAAVGAIPCHRAGRALRFDLDEVRVWMKQQAAQEIVNRQDS